MNTDDLRPNVSIRDATPDDREIIADFNRRMARETESRDLEPAIIGSGVAALLGDARKGRYWIATVDGRVAGQIMVTYEWSDWRNGMLWWIQSVYVHPDFRRMGVFTALYRHVERLARADREACGLRLYVEERNTRAQATYRSLGMADPRYNVMESIFSD